MQIFILTIVTLVTFLNLMTNVFQYVQADRYIGEMYKINRNQRQELARLGDRLGLLEVRQDVRDES